jgi:uncharacterized protein (DUF2249 family)
VQRVFSCGFAKQPDTLYRVDQAVKVEAGVSMEFVEYVPDLLPTHELIRKYDTLYSVLTANLQLLHCSHRNRPGAVLELPLEELRARRRLPMWSDHSPGETEKTAHPLTVVLQSRFLEHCQWEW